MQLRKIADIFKKKNLWKMYLVRIFEIVELISSNWKVIV